MAVLVGLGQFDEAVDRVVLEVGSTPYRTDYLLFITVFSGYVEPAENRTLTAAGNSSQSE